MEKLLKIMSEEELKQVKGGKKKLPSWVKWSNGISGLVGELAEPGSINWKHHH
ncbi:Putative uncharacterized protein [Lactobacillus equicursoris 66c]|uniref:Bacteriocin-type signal sequence n=1 Tax=Lactobacillus equicursoris 66c TaxID=872326 RepID=K0NQ61_9LACO|nr:bacteriocin [Lactobacillus equicursoris]CCK83033.1 Putative uncharacterized protein [Lactobacillus equicursoris 66c]